MIGDFLYGLTPKELLTSPAPERVLAFAGNNIAAASVTADAITVPVDHIFLCSNLSALGIAGAGQTVTNISWFVSLGATFLGTIARWNPPLAAPIQNWGDSRHVQFVLMPGEVLTVGATFNAGANANILSASIMGLLLPRGNFQLR